MNGESNSGARTAGMVSNLRKYDVTVTAYAIAKCRRNLVSEGGFPLLSPDGKVSFPASWRRGEMTRPTASIIFRYSNAHQVFYP
jgi:hypothetical protein